MTDYIALRIDASPCTPDTTDLIAAFLADAGYESFSSDETGITAYINADLYSPQKVEEALGDFPMDTTLSGHITKIEGQDWNSEWEKNYFQPIIIGDNCVIHSSFHTDYPHCEYDITIDPKMAFGTGHHSTTSLMARFLLEMDMKDKSVVDMGTGTGILSILSSMRGAQPVTGIEIDQGAYENALENASLNKVAVALIHGDASALSDVAPADIFIANINRNIILADLPHYVRTLKSGGTMLLSGFYMKDVEKIEKAAALYGLKTEEVRDDHDWCGMRLTLHG